MAVENNDKVSIHYTGKLDDGSVFDSSEGTNPLDFIVGKGMVIPGFEEGVLGMEVGEEKTIKIDEQNAYGPVMKELIQEVPRDQLPAEIVPEVDMMLSAQSPEGHMIPVKIVEVTENSIKIDMNHPLAGKALTFEVKLEKIVKASDLPADEAKEECDSDSCSSCSSCGGH